ncbi:hypothetical protein HPP92_025978 [Vanilla planifolia]|uniref:Uncharacterized protein n=1 Tax=Vanilla planifolia TaxID=51239 RepID=A0A835PK90_VANPL|nr:hypothetical protein HPP92_025978 [Vanilla planifolia]
MEEEEERFARREMLGTTMIRVTNAKEIASVVTKGGRSRSVCNETAHQFPTHCGLRHRPKMKMIAKQQRWGSRGCLLDLNFPPPLEEEHEELDQRKI